MHIVTYATRNYTRVALHMHIRQPSCCLSLSLAHPRSTGHVTDWSGERQRTTRAVGPPAPSGPHTRVPRRCRWPDLAGWLQARNVAWPLTRIHSPKLSRARPTVCRVASQGPSAREERRGRLDKASGVDVQAGCHVMVVVRGVRRGKGAIFGAYAASMCERGGAMRVLRVFVKDAVRVPPTRGVGCA